MLNRLFDNRFGVLAIAGVTGAIWAIIIGVVIAMTASLLSGEGFAPQMGALFLAGAVGGAAGLYHRFGSAIGFGVLLLLLTLLTLLQPFGAGPPLIWLLLSLASLVALFSWAVNLSIAPLSLLSINRYRREQSIMLTLRGVGFVVFGVLVALPLFVLVMTSLKSQQSLLANPLDLLPDFSDGLGGPFSSYVELFTVYNFGTYLWNSTFISVITVILTLSFAVPGAYAVSRLNFPGRRALSRSILLIYLVPAIVLVIPLYAIFSQLGLRDSLWGLIVVYPATTLPVALYMLQGYFRGIPQELEEAGMMDGCSRLRVILSITLPLSLPALASVGLYVFMIAWNEFLFAFMFLDDPKMFTLSRGVVSLNSSEVPRQHLMAGAVISTLPIVVIFLYAERFMVKGLTSGGVKG